MLSEPAINQVQSAITDEVFYALGLNRRGSFRHVFGWAFAKPTFRFSKMMVSVDRAVKEGGPQAGCKALLDIMKVKVSASGVENIPTEGPTLILSNHPGAYDSVAIGSLVPRLDLKIIAAITRLYQVLPHIHPVMIYASRDPKLRLTALRQAVAHFMNGGTLLQFSSGNIDPDPALSPITKEDFKIWHRSFELFLKKVPNLIIVPTIASNVLLKNFAEHPLTRIRRKPMDQRRLGEFVQIIRQILNPNSIEAHPFISFGKPLTMQDFVDEETGNGMMETLLLHVKELLTTHLKLFHPNQTTE